MNAVDKAVTILDKGGIIIYPTDTAFGIGCRIDKEESIKRLYKLRRRPENQAMPILVNSIDMANKYWKAPLPSKIKNLMKEYWPGALTIIYFCNTKMIPSLVRADKETIGIRMPDNNTVLSIIDRIKVPLLGSSANFHGNPTPFKYKDLDPELLKLVDFVLDGESILKKASTVVDCTVKPERVLRAGSVKI